MDEARGSTRLLDSSGNGYHGTIGTDVSIGVRSSGATVHSFPYIGSTAPPDPAGRLHVMTSAPRSTRDGRLRRRVALPQHPHPRQHHPEGPVRCVGRVLEGRGRRRAPLLRVLRHVGLGGDEVPGQGTDDVWRTVRCERKANEAVMFLDGVQQARPQVRTGSIANDWTLVVGGKSSCNSTDSPVRLLPRRPRLPEGRASQRARPDDDHDHPPHDHHDTTDHHDHPTAHHDHHGATDDHDDGRPQLAAAGRPDRLGHGRRFDDHRDAGRRATRTARRSPGSRTSSRAGVPSSNGGVSAGRVLGQLHGSLGHPQGVREPARLAHPPGGADRVQRGRRQVVAVAVSRPGARPRGRAPRCWPAPAARRRSRRASPWPAGTSWTSPSAVTRPHSVKKSLSE